MTHGAPGLHNMSLVQSIHMYDGQERSQSHKNSLNINVIEMNTCYEMLCKSDIQDLALFRIFNVKCYIFKVQIFIYIFLIKETGLKRLRCVSPNE